jgi:hypothetical protein
MHWLVSVLHRPLLQSLLTKQATHVLTLVSQTGVLPEQSSLAEHPGLQVHDCVSHSPLAPTQSLSFTHPTQVFALGWHTSLAPQSELLRHATQVLSLVSHNGLFPPQSVLLRHSTQVLALVSHTGLGFSQSALAWHATHRPLPVSQMAAGSLQSPLLVQSPGTQVCEPTSHTSVPVQSLSSRQATHWLTAVSHTPVVQCAVVLHSTHSPTPALVSQWGVSPLQSASVAQGPMH